MRLQQDELLRQGMCVSIEAMMSKKPSIVKGRKEGVYLFKRHMKQAENIQRMVATYIVVRVISAE
jgi:methionine aminopeptidase